MINRRAFALILAILWLWPIGLNAQSDKFVEAVERAGTLL